MELAPLALPGHPPFNGVPLGDNGLWRWRRGCMARKDLYARKRGGEDVEVEIAAVNGELRRLRRELKTLSCGARGPAFFDGSPSWAFWGVGYCMASMTALSLTWQADNIRCSVGNVALTMYQLSGATRIGSTDFGTGSPGLPGAVPSGPDPGPPSP